jgi:hypothetical protein
LTDSRLNVANRRQHSAFCEHCGAKAATDFFESKGTCTKRTYEFGGIVIASIRLKEQSTSGIGALTSYDCREGLIQ